MSTRYLSLRTSVFLVSAILFLTTGCKNTAPGHGYSRVQDFNNGWLFFEGTAEGAENPAFNDADWRTVDLPHDWSVEDYAVQDSTHYGPFFKAMENGHDVGYLRGGTGWYRKSFTVPPSERNKQVILNFDGVQSEATLFVNGKEAGRHVYGYTPFHFNITPYLNHNGKAEVLAVKVYKPEQNSRWFTGAGIYRPVAISYLSPVHIAPWGVGVTSTLPGDNKAEIVVKVMLENSDSTDADVTLHADILSQAKVKVAEAEQQGKLSSNGTASFALTTAVAAPELWDISKPVLYTASVSLMRHGVAIDTYEVPFGIRTIRFSAEEGFLLNGKPVLMKGGCMHHDNGLLGAAAFNRAEERRVEIMKKNGFNAIRTSHNPPSKAFLDACDRQGMLVIDEAFDCWMKAKRPNDYHTHFNDWWKHDLDEMILRDRNHPSIVIWSIGNEIQERSDSAGLVIARNLIREIKSIDTTRPITEAVCAFWDNPGKDWDYSANAFSVLDVCGYNYQWQNYENDHAKYPDRIMAGTESVPKEAFENWRLVKSQPYVIGDFVWTGWDYLGEAGIGHATWQSDKHFQDPFAMPWPWYVSNCGDIDITGHKKPQSYYRDVVWGESNLEMAVHEPAPDGKFEMVFFWGWPQEVQSWNWPGEEGKPLKVTVYSSYPKVRLELNGTVLGEQEIPADSAYKARFTVPYQPGELKVSGIDNGEVKETKVFQTSGQVVRLKLEPERTTIRADRGEIVYINVTAVDSAGNIVPDASLPVRVKISGEGELLAAGNASPQAEGSLQDNSFTLFRGRGQIIVRSTGKAGSIMVEATPEGVENAKTEVRAGD